jgi:hypothetical protein
MPPFSMAGVNPPLQIRPKLRHYGNGDAGFGRVGAASLPPFQVVEQARRDNGK